MIAKCEKQKYTAGYFASRFSRFASVFHFLHFAPGLAIARKVIGFRSLFFRGINKTQNSHEIRKVYSECCIFCGIFCENIREIPVKCEIRKVYSAGLIKKFEKKCRKFKKYFQKN